MPGATPGRLHADLLLALPPSVRARRELQGLLYGVLKAEGRLGELAGAEAARQGYLSTLVRNLRAFERVAQILDAGARAGVALMPLKGALFADALYEDPGLRPMADVDLLVRPVELGAAVRLMEGLGFARVFEPARARFSPRHGHDVAFADAGGELVVEVHYKLFHELGVDAAVEPVFERAVACRTLGAERSVPSWDDHLFITLVHAATHAFGESPVWLFDAALLVARAGGVERAAEEARRRRAARAFAAALRMAHRLLPACVPAPSPPTAPLRDPLLARVLGPEPLGDAPGRLRSLLARALLTDDPRDAVREIARKLELRAVELKERLFGLRKEP